MLVEFVENPVWGMKDLALKDLDGDLISEVLHGLDPDERDEIEDSLLAIIHKMFETPLTEIMLQ